MKKILSLLCCLALLTLCLPFTAVSVQAEETSDHILRYGISEGPATIDPTNLGDIISYEMVRQCYNGLTDREPNGKVIPGLAESWELSEDGMNCRFQLKKGVKFHSGNELKASDVKFTFEYDLLPERESGSGSYLSEVEGAQDMMEGKSKELKGFEILNDYEFVIHFSEPNFYFPEYCSVESLYIVEEAEVKDAGEDWWTKKSAGTGPYILAAYEPDEKISFKSNKDYFNGAPAIDGIDFIIVPEDSTAMQMYENDELDVIGAPFDQLELIKKDEKLSQELCSFPQSCHTYFGMTQSAYEPFQDIRVRQALSLVIDQEDLSKKIFNDTISPLYGILPEGFNGFNKELKPWEHDANKARKLLEEAGYNKDNPLPELEIYCMGWDEDTSVYVKHQLETELGMTVSIQVADRSTLLDVLSEHKAPSYIFGSTAAYGDARALMYTAFTTEGRRNFSAYSNPDYDKIMADTALMSDVEKRNELYQKAEKLVIDDFGFVPLYVDMTFLMVKPYVKDMKLSGLGMDILDTVKLEK